MEQNMQEPLEELKILPEETKEPEALTEPEAVEKSIETESEGDEKLTGTVVYRYENKGSKSEGMFPYLYIQNGRFVKIWLDGDYSLFGDDLKKFDGRHVSVRGTRNEYDYLIVTHIERTDVVSDIDTCDT